MHQKTKKQFTLTSTLLWKHTYMWKYY